MGVGEGHLLYLILSNGITKEREVGPGKSDPFWGMCKLPRIPCPSLLWALGVGVSE